jgi:TonB family protein
MRPYVGQKIGQSGFELIQAVFFSFFLHAAIVIATLFLYTAVNSKIYVPPSYTVKLVSLPAEQSAEHPSETPPMPQPEPVKVKPKEIAKKAQPKVVPKKGAMPEYGQKKQKPAPQAEEKPEDMQKPEAKPSAKTPGVAVSTATGEDFKFPPYLALVRDKIEQNWNPPPGVQGAKSKVQFTVLRSGRVGDAKLIEASGNFYFDQAAVRAILMASPLPPMPEGFYRDSAVFTVDLMERN